MSAEIFRPYSERNATVVGGRGALGKRIVSKLEPLGFGSVQVCEEGDPFPDFVDRSTDIFFAVDDKTISSLLRSTKDQLRPGEHTILDGSSVKLPLIPLYEELDEKGISVASTHLGAVPTQPWRGIKVWVCDVGTNSERAKRLATDIFISTNSSIQMVDIKDHVNVETDQWFTMATAHIVAGALKGYGLNLQKFDLFSTLNSELLALPIGRTLGQGVKVPSEVIFNQPRKEELIDELELSLQRFWNVINDLEALRALMQENIDFHDNPAGFIKQIFDKAGVIGARNANLRMHSLSFRITEDRPGLLYQLLPSFYEEGANLNAIDSMPGAATEEEIEKGVDPDKIVDFHIGVDPDTINEDKERRIKERLAELGCTV